MYRLNKKIIFIIFFVCNIFLNNIFANSSFNESFKNNFEDKKIFEALNAIDNNNLSEAFNIYEELYKNTKKLEYLKEIIIIAMQMQKYGIAINYIKDYENKHSNNVEIKKYLAHSYMTLNNIDDAIKVYTQIVKLEDNAINNKVLSNLYFFKNNLVQSRIYLIKSYNLEPDEQTLLNLALIDLSSKNFDATLPLIKDFFKNGTSELFAQVLSESAFSNDALPKAEELYSYYLKNNPNEQNAKNLIKIHLLKNDMDKALNLVKKYNLDFNLLIEIYMSKKDYKSARFEANEALKKTQDNLYLGIIAIIDFEEAEDKKSVLDNVIKNFKEALKVNKNHVFYNYLGYLLIDYDINIDEGMHYVNEALKLDPNNPAYLDSIAWGYFKKHDCQNAKKQFNKISKDEINQNEELKIHFDKINECLAK